MPRFARRMAIASAAIFLAGCCATAVAAELPAPQQDATQPRFAVHAPRLRAAPTRNSIDSRFHLDARLQAASAEGQHGSGLALHAKVIDASAAACSNTLFADGFE